MSTPEAESMRETLPTIREPIIVMPDALYTDEALRLLLGLGENTIARARREGGLRCARRGNRNFYLGRWVLDWLTREDVPKVEVAVLVAEVPEEPA